MSDRSAIEWTDATWNPITGSSGRWHCTKVSPGCQFCYAERLNTRFGGPKYNVGADILRLDEKKLEIPLGWRTPRRIFVNSMTDLFHENAPIEWIARIWNVMASATVDCGKRHRHDDECWSGPMHTFQVLTKRAHRMREIVTELPNYVGNSLHGDSPISLALEMGDWPLPNVHLLVSAENQQYADERISHLLRTPAAVRGVSLEPLLGGINLVPYIGSYGGHPLPRLDWVIVGGESGGPAERALVEVVNSGHGIRPLELKPEAKAWVRSIRDQCQAAGVPFFFKQWGGPKPHSGGRLLDGHTWDEFPRRTA